MSKIQLRRDTSANWASANPVLAQGEPGMDTTTGVVKVGDGSTAWSALGSKLMPADICMIVFGKDTARAVGSGDNPFGPKLQRAVLITGFTARCLTADASGSTTVQLYKNGTAISGTSLSITAANQVAGQSLTGLSVALAAGDVLTCQVVSTGTTPGNGLVVDVQAVCA